MLPDTGRTGIEGHIVKSGICTQRDSRAPKPLVQHRGTHFQALSAHRPGAGGSKTAPEGLRKAPEGVRNAPTPPKRARGVCEGPRWLVSNGQLRIVGLRRTAAGA